MTGSTNMKTLLLLTLIFISQITLAENKELCHISVIELESYEKSKNRFEQIKEMLFDKGYSVDLKSKTAKFNKKNAKKSQFIDTKRTQNELGYILEIDLIDNSYGKKHTLGYSYKLAQNKKDLRTEFKDIDGNFIYLHSKSKGLAQGSKALYASNDLRTTFLQDKAIFQQAVASIPSCKSLKYLTTRI